MIRILFINIEVLLYSDKNFYLYIISQENLSNPKIMIL